MPWCTEIMTLWSFTFTINHWLLDKALLHLPTAYYPIFSYPVSVLVRLGLYKYSVTCTAPCSAPADCLPGTEQLTHCSRLLPSCSLPALLLPTQSSPGMDKLILLLPSANPILPKLPCSTISPWFDGSTEPIPSSSTGVQDTNCCYGFTNPYPISVQPWKICSSSLNNNMFAMAYLSLDNLCTKHTS